MRYRIGVCLGLIAVACNGPTKSAQPTPAANSPIDVVPSARPTSDASKGVAQQDKKPLWFKELVRERPPANMFSGKKREPFSFDKGIVDPGPFHLEDVKPSKEIVSGLAYVDSPENRAMASIALLFVNKNDRLSRCVGWLYRKDILVTNRHCTKGASEGSHFVASFDYYAGVPWSALQWYACSPIALANDFDVAALQCRSDEGAFPGEKYGTLTLSTKEPAVGDAVFVVQQNCDYRDDPSCEPVKKRAPAKVKDQKNIEAFEFAHTGTTLKGSSGAPVLLANTFEVIGMHHASCAKKDQCGDEDDSLQKSIYNVAIRASQVQQVLSKLPASN